MPLTRGTGREGENAEKNVCYEHDVFSRVKTSRRGVYTKETTTAVSMWYVLERRWRRKRKRIHGATRRKYLQIVYFNNNNNNIIRGTSEISVGSSTKNEIVMFSTTVERTRVTYDGKRQKTCQRENVICSKNGVAGGEENLYHKYWIECILCVERKSCRGYYLLYVSPTRE